MLNAIQNTNYPSEKRQFGGLGLPPEVWLLIFPNLKTTDLGTVSLVCKPFRYMAQPMLFSVLDVSPFLLAFNTERFILRPQIYLTRLLTRLKCYKQPHIAHGVRHCWVSPYTRSGFPPRNPQDDLDPNSVINVLLESLPLFPNLTTLSWHRINFAFNWWSVIQSLNIKTLWLNSSSIPVSPRPLSFVVHLDLDHWPWEGRVTNQVSIHEEPDSGVDQTTLENVIQPDVILSISVPRLDTASNVFAVLSQTTSQLRVLKIPFFSLSDSKFVSALWMCPRLEVLCIFPLADMEVPDVTLDPIPPTCLPCLVNYEGPYTQILNICHQPLERVSLWGFHERPGLCKPDDLTETLNGLAQHKSVKSLKSLTVLVINITFDFLKSFSAFENLEHLSVQSQERDIPVNAMISPSCHITALYDMIGAVILPSSLKSIKVSTRLCSDENLLVQEHQAASFIQAFASRYPKVQRIDITYGVYWKGTYTAKWGRIRQNNEENLIPNEGDSSPAVRKVNESDGYSSKSSSKDCLMSTVISSVNPLPLGKLMFTEHRRMILFQTRPPSSTGSFRYHGFFSSFNGRRLLANLWLGLRRFFGKNSI